MIRTKFSLDFSQQIQSLVNINFSSHNLRVHCKYEA